MKPLVERSCLALCQPSHSPPSLETAKFRCWEEGENTFEKKQTKGCYSSILCAQAVNTSERLSCILFASTLSSGQPSGKRIACCREEIVVGAFFFGSTSACLLHLYQMGGGARARWQDLQRPAHCRSERQSGEKKPLFIKASLQTALGDYSFLQRTPWPAREKMATSMFRGQPS